MTPDRLGRYRNSLRVIHVQMAAAKRIDGAGKVGAHKTSMLQDLEQGRPMEIDALVAAVRELGRLVEVPTPTIAVVLALIQRRAARAAQSNSARSP